jgi:ABC-type antimicrobial peptide transport system permease subunit
LVRREGLTVAATGTVLGCVVTAGALVAVHVSLGTVSESVHTRVPWLTMLAVAAGCTAITLTAGIVPARRALRAAPAARRP